MCAQMIRFKDDNGVRSILLDRPDKVNALSNDMLNELAEAVSGAGPAELIVIAGNGPKGFCAGADIAEFLRSPKELERQEQGIKALITALVDAPCPVIAAIHGRTLGAGVMISCLSDLVIAADNVVMGLPEIRFNMYPVIVHAALEEKVSSALAFQLCATGRLLNGAEAQALGLVADLLPAADFAAELARKIAFYRERIAALSIAKRTLRLDGKPKILDRVVRLAPLMHENYSRPGVHETITNYMKTK